MRVITDSKKAIGHWFVYDLPPPKLTDWQITKY